MKKAVLTFACIVLAFASAVPAHAATVSVTFKKSIAQYQAVVKTCALTVPSGANGIQILNAAVASGCISSYHTIKYPSGDFVSCIDDVCDVPWHDKDLATPADSFSPLYWELFKDGVCTPYGIDDFRATAGAEMDFTFTTWLTFVTPLPC